MTLAARPQPPVIGNPHRARVSALVVDDHPLARRGVAAILRVALRCERIAGAGDALEALRQVIREPPDLVLLDTHIPGSMPARELTSQICALAPSALVVLLAEIGRPHEVDACMRAGARACLLKDTGEFELARALRAVVAGASLVDPRIGSATSVATLTTREREVLDLLALGCSNRQIANQLVISEPTVKGHVSRLLDKLAARSRLEAVAKASELRLV